ASSGSRAAGGFCWASRTALRAISEQPARERAVAAKAPKLCERGGEYGARHVLARRLVANPQPHVAENAVEVAVVQREKRPRLLARRGHQCRVRIERATA